MRFTSAGGTSNVAWLAIANNWVEGAWLPGWGFHFIVPNPGGTIVQVFESGVFSLLLASAAVSLFNPNSVHWNAFPKPLFKSDSVHWDANFKPLIKSNSVHWNSFLKPLFQSDSVHWNALLKLDRQAHPTFHNDHSRSFQCQNRKCNRVKVYK
jgi:hypothetical protein